MNQRDSVQLFATSCGSYISYLLNTLEAISVVYYILETKSVLLDNYSIWIYLLVLEYLSEIDTACYLLDLSLCLGHLSTIWLTSLMDIIHSRTTY